MTKARIISIRAFVIVLPTEVKAFSVLFVNNSNYSAGSNCFRIYIHYLA